MPRFSWIGFSPVALCLTAETCALGCWEYLTMAHEISLGISAGSFGFVVGFLSGYAVRAYLSLVHRKQRKYHAGIVTAGCLLAMSQSAQAVSIDISAEAPGVLLPSLPSAMVFSFDNLSFHSLPFYQFHGGVLAGSGPEKEIRVVGKSAQPAGDATGFFIDGQQQSATSKRYIEFRLGPGLYDQIVLSTAEREFEADNIAFGDPG
jgi:hypothetical protein